MKTYTAIALLLLVLVMASTDTATGQQCGPGCPVCSGECVGDLLAPSTLFGSVLYIPEGDEETAVFSLRYGFFTWMDAGIGYALDEENVIWSVRFAPITQDQEGWRPGLILGTGSVQARGSDQSAFILLAKTREIVEGTFGISLAGGYATDLPDLEQNWGLATVTLTFFDRVSPFYTYDGINSHLGLSFFATEWLTLTAYALEMDELGIMTAFQWGLGAEDDEGYE